MWIKNLNISNCRLLESINIDFSPHLNLIVGDNASGKTSLLESLSLLSTGKSFRTSHISEVITHDQTSILVSAKIEADNSLSQVGIEKNVGKTRIRINQKDIFSQAVLSSHLPITIIHPDSIHLITGGPSQRRSYVDWLCFYLFSEFHRKWKEYRHVLKQRNLCLKYTKHRYALGKWTDELVLHQPEIIRYRKKALELLTPKLNKIAAVLLNDIKLDLEIKTGFPVGVDIDTNALKEFYKNKEEYDIQLKRTSAGVHRTDIKIIMDNKPAIEEASRGQLKLLAFSLLIAQNEAIVDSDSKKGILLIDDLASELDKHNQNKLMEFLSSLNQQLIITATKQIKAKEMGCKMFHVKHGSISEE